jgi:hypothetical protein
MSDLLARLVRHARNEDRALRPILRLYGDSDESFELVEEEEAEGAVTHAPAAPARPRATEHRPEPAPPRTPAVVPTPAEPVRAPMESTRQIEGAPKRGPETPQPPPVHREETAQATPGQRLGEPALPPSRRRRPPRVEKPLSEPAAPVLPVIVERRIELTPPQDVHEVSAPPVRPVETPRPAVPGWPTVSSTRIEPDLPAPQIREQVFVAPETAPESPVIHVSIGRVELRAPASAPAPRPVELARPKQSLDDYLLARDRTRA